MNGHRKLRLTDQLAHQSTGRLELFFATEGYGDTFARASKGYGRAKRIADVIREADAEGTLDTLLDKAAVHFHLEEDMIVDDDSGPVWMSDAGETCFVIQPFDDGPYDNRYDDIYEKAIEAAGLRPYRVDRDPSASIPIERIASQIKDAAVVFADISENNPNVWFELGLAIASLKEVVLVCSVKRERFPFDVQHRHIIRYETESRRDFDALQSDITDRLLAARKVTRGRENIEDLSPLKDTAGLSAHEQVLLVLIAQRMESPLSKVYSYSIRQDMQAAGFNDIAFVLSARSLARRRFIEVTLDTDRNGEDSALYAVADEGFEWLDGNQDKLELRRGSPNQSPSAASPTDDTDLDDLPF